VDFWSPGQLAKNVGSNCHKARAGFVLLCEVDSSAAMHHRHEREMTTMSTYKSNDESIPTDTDACYEAVASQEEIYLEEEVEDLRAILIFGESDVLCDSKNDVPEVLRSEAATPL
jgi:hypothetical protein